MKEQFILIIGHFTFSHNFTFEQKIIFKEDKKNNVICHEVDSVQLFTDKYEAQDTGEESESTFIILPIWKGEIIFDTEELKEKTQEEISLLTESIKLP